jgi:hypothetical protein
VPERLVVVADPVGNDRLCVIVLFEALLPNAFELERALTCSPKIALERWGECRGRGSTRAIQPD